MRIPIGGVIREEIDRVLAEIGKTEAEVYVPFTSAVMEFNSPQCGHCNSHYPDTEQAVLNGKVIEREVSCDCGGTSKIELHVSINEKKVGEFKMTIEQNQKNEIENYTNEIMAAFSEFLPEISIHKATKRAEKAMLRLPIEAGGVFTSAILSAMATVWLGETNLDVESLLSGGGSYGINDKDIELRTLATALKTQTIKEIEIDHLIVAIQLNIQYKKDAEEN